MRAHRITSNGEAVPASRLAPTPPHGVPSVARAGRGAARRLGCCVAALAIGLAAPAGAAHRRVAANVPASSLGATDEGGPGHAAPVLAAAEPSDAAAGDAPDGRGATVPPADAGVPPSAPGPVAGPLGSAVGVLAPQRARGRARRAAETMPGCTGMATLDGVSAALQAGPFGRRKGLAIMQFRNVVTDSAEDGRVACHSDVLLSDGSLHRAEYGLRRVGRSTRVHIEVAGEREDAGPAASGTPAGPPATPASPDAGTPGAAPVQEEPVTRPPAT